MALVTHVINTNHFCTWNVTLLANPCDTRYDLNQTHWKKHTENYDVQTERICQW